MNLSEKQKEMLEKHKSHYSTKHLQMMKKLMKEGKSFTQSHKLALKSVGK